MISTSELSTAFVGMADSLVDDFDLVDFLHDLTVHAAHLSGADAVGIVLADHAGRVRYMASSNESGRLMELLQLQSSEGPCLDCVRTGVPVVNADLAHAGDRWPVFAPQARSAGFAAVHAFPLRLRRDVLGALNLFSSEAMTFSEEEVGVVQALADVATIAIMQERAIARAEAVTEQLQGALNSRIVVEQAKGALAQAAGITISEAFELLRSRARSTRRKLVDVAGDVLAEIADEAGRPPS
ncbi:GAF and ANTAR domain-containing protein [Nocardioides marinquilinus]|uniref:GAF and ANTAR domain-containing protein n=1 Tax=Nocardioides marinquilinus TaxID=1210400 RepID=A0ABP9P6E5_9ACTN